MSETGAYEALRLAQLHEHTGLMASSAKLTARDAELAFNRGDFERAHGLAVLSLKYSLGIFSEVYQKARELK